MSCGLVFLAGVAEADEEPWLGARGGERRGGRAEESPQKSGRRKHSSNFRVGQAAMAVVAEAWARRVRKRERERGRGGSGRLSEIGDENWSGDGGGDRNKRGELLESGTG